METNCLIHNATIHASHANILAFSSPNGSLSAKSLNFTIGFKSVFHGSTQFNYTCSPLRFKRIQRHFIFPLSLAGNEPFKKTDSFEKNGNSTRQGRGEKQAQLLEQNRKLMIMQKELLEQIEERKKLRMTLMDSLDTKSEATLNSNDPKSEKISKSTFQRMENSDSKKSSSEFSSPKPSSSFSSYSSPSSTSPSSSFFPSPSLSSPSSTPPSQTTGTPSSASDLSTEFEKRDAVNYDSKEYKSKQPFFNTSVPQYSSPSSSSSSFTPSQPKVSPSQRSPPPPSISLPAFEKASPPSSIESTFLPIPKSYRTTQRPLPTPKQLTPTELMKRKKESQTSLRLLQEEKEKENKAREPEIPEKKEPLAGPNVMNVVVVASECAPWSKTGGLGDVVGALPKALARRGHRVMVVAPRYANYEEAWDTTIRKQFNVAGQDMEIGYFHGYVDGVDFVFIDHPMYHHNAKNIYGGSREEVLCRMVLLCKASIESVWHVPCGGVSYGDGNLVFIANDWHTALLPVYLQAYYRDHGLMEFTRSILVIHNMAHQGRGPMTDFGFLGLPDHYASHFQLYDSLFGGEHMNVFMAGLLSAHKLIAVSHGYAWECQTPEGGWGLDAVMRENAGKLRGVVNGIDDKEWNPELDIFLKDDGYTNYTMDSLENKAVCKAALQRELGLPVRPDVPLVGFIGRLDHQKGVDIIADASHWMMEQDMQLVMLGTGRSDLEDLLRNLESSHNQKVRGWVGFSVKTAHRITAGVDILMMPSRFEPCGLNQLYAMKYGTIPVVHSVGGLKDTVKPFDPFNNTGYGWTFDHAEASGLIHALGNSMYTYREFKQSWIDLQKRCMEQDLSWDYAAQQYEEVLLGAKYCW